MADLDERLIGDLLAAYQGAVRTGNRKSLEDVFHPDATVCYPDPDTGNLVTSTAEAFAEEVAALVAGGELVDETTRSCRIDVAGSVAVARVDFLLQIAEAHYEGTDFFSLARAANTWQITQKLYAMKPVTGP